MSWVALGDRAIRVSRPAGVAPRALVRAVRGWPGVVDVVVAREDIGIYFDKAFDTRAPQLDDRIAALAELVDEDAPARTIELRAVYNGDDLEAVARAVGLSTREVIELHAGATYTVETMGFAPGFAYMTGLPEALVRPRRPSPRTRVPAGSIAIAGGYTSVYPFDSPGGWHLLGRVVDAVMFGPEGPLLGLGDRVVFVR